MPTIRMMRQLRGDSPESLRLVLREHQMGLTILPPPFGLLQPEVIQPPGCIHSLLSVATRIPSSGQEQLSTSMARPPSRSSPVVRWDRRIVSRYKTDTIILSEYLTGKARSAPA